MDARAWDDRYAASGLVWSLGPNALVARECADLPAGRAVDLACGEGRNALWLASRGWRVEAVDFSQVALDKGRALAVPPETGVGADAITWRRSDVTTWSGSDLDLAVVAYLQLPAPARGDALRAAYAALRPGGTFVLVAHDSTNLTEGTGGPRDASVLYTAEDVLDDLATGAPTPRVEHARRVAREVRVAAGQPPEHRESADGDVAVAWDCFVRLVRT